MTVPEWVAAALGGIGAVGGFTGLAALYRARSESHQNEAKTESIKVEAAERVVNILMTQVGEMQQQIVDMKEEIRTLERKLSLLESELVRIGADPTKLYMEAGIQVRDR